MMLDPIAQKVTTMTYLYSFLDAENNVLDVVMVRGTKYTMDNLGRLRFF